jgi:uncharacterized protein YtpQ (UPF0354 family)
MIKRPQTKDNLAMEIAIRNKKTIAPRVPPDSEGSTFWGLVREPRISETHVLSEQILTKLKSFLKTFTFQEIGVLQFLCRAHRSVEEKLFVLHLKELATTGPQDHDEILKDVATNIKRLTAYGLEGYIIPLLRSSDNIPLKSFHVDFELITEPFTPELTILYGVEDEPRFGILSPAFLEVEGWTREELRAKAIPNVVGSLGQSAMVEGTDPIEIRADGVFVSSLLLLPDIWRTEELNFTGDIVVAVPALDKMFVADSNDPAAVQRLQSKATEELQSAVWPITEKLFVMREGKPVPYVPGTGIGGK